MPAGARTTMIIRIAVKIPWKTTRLTLSGSPAPANRATRMAHAGENGGDEDDDHQENLPAHADGGVTGEADIVPHEGVIDDALETGDDVLQHRRPRQLPHGFGDRALNNLGVEFLRLRITGGHWRRSGIVTRAGVVILTQ